MVWQWSGILATAPAAYQVFMHYFTPASSRYIVILANVM